MTSALRSMPHLYQPKDWIPDWPRFKMFQAIDCHIAEYICLYSKFEPMSTKLWQKLVVDATSIIDIGAQVGTYSLLAASLRKDITIHAFEPNPDAHARLRLHRQINGFSNIKTHREALGGNSSLMELTWIIKPGKEQHISSGASLTHKGAINVEKVVCTMRPFVYFGISLGSKGVIKIDVEGGEKGVLMGMSLAEKPDIILESFDQGCCDAWTEATKPLGYKYYFIDEENMKLEQRDRLIPASFASHNFNQFITTKELTNIPV